MGEVRRDGDLPQKARGAERTDEIRVKDLQGDPAIVLAVARQIHGRHATMTELALDVVAVGESSAESLGDGVRYGQWPSGGRRSSHMNRRGFPCVGDEVGPSIRPTHNLEIPCHTNCCVAAGLVPCFHSFSRRR